MSRIILAAALALAATFASVQAQAQVIRTYVSTTGSDSSLTQPCRHFQAALAATSAGGEVDALEPGGYGSVTISQAVTIDGEGWSYLAPPAGEAAITINLVSGSVSIRGVSLNGVGTSGTTGIQFMGGGSLNVQNSVIRNFDGSGIVFTPSAPSQLKVSNTQVADNNGDGISIGPMGSAGIVTAVLNQVEIENNSVYGFILGGGVETGELSAIVSESVIAGNTQWGFIVQSGSATAPTALTLFHSVVANNLIGIGADSNYATITIAQSMVTGNTNVPWLAQNGGVINSFGDNYFSNNGDVNPGNPNVGSLTNISKE
jgi:hypothetical protein